MIFSHEIFNVENLKFKHSDKSYQKAKKKIFEYITNKSLGFLEDLYVKDYDKISKVVKELKQFENILFLGTGGSSLGGKTLVSTVDDYFYNLKEPKVFFIENIDEKLINNLLSSIDQKKTAIVVTSKSGETIETISQFFLSKIILRKKKFRL